MTSTNDPEVFKRRWHEHVRELEKLKMSLHTDQFEELDEALGEVHDLIDDAANEVNEE